MGETRIPGVMTWDRIGEAELEIEITPAMIDAGAEVLRHALLKAEVEDDRELAEDVFRAMARHLVV